MKSDNMNPTREKPLLFFSYFFESGLKDFYNIFLGISNNQFRNSNLFDDAEKDYTKGVLTITKDEANAGSSGEFMLFEDELNSLLQLQQTQLLKVAEDYFVAYNDCNKCNRYINMISNRLITLTTESSQKDLLKKYPLIELNVIKTIQLLYDSLIRDFPESTIPETIAVLIKKYNQPLYDGSNTGFQFNSQYVAKLPHLYESLKEQGFISNDTAFADFEAAFSGKRLLKPKVKWIKLGVKNTSSISKATIFYFVQELSNKGIIKTINDDEIKAKVSLVFLNYDSNKLQNIKGSFSEFKHNRNSSESDTRPLINNIISRLIN